MDRYQKEIAPQLAQKLGRKNVLSLPRLQKIVVNMGVGKALQDKNRMEQAAEQLTQITGQKAQVTKAKVAVSGFRLREGNEIGCRVTLRGRRMYEFLDRLISIALPRIRDFRGVNPKSFDGHGNYSLGLTEQLVFPEIDPDKVTFTQGMDITFVTSTQQRRRGPRTAPRLRHAVPRSVNTTVPSEPWPPKRKSCRFNEAKMARSRWRSWKPSTQADQGQDAAARAHPHPAALQAVRPAARRLSQVRHLPHLLPQHGQRRPDPRRQEGELVRVIRP